MKNLIKLPGLIDVHVHLREPGATQKEDFTTGTKAAIAGGYTTVLDMPNNPEPTVTLEALEKKIKLAQGVIPSVSSVIPSEVTFSLHERDEARSSTLREEPSRLRLEENLKIKSRDPSLVVQDDKKDVQNDKLASRIFCDVGFHFGASKESIQYFDEVKDKVFGLKLYMNHTTGELLIEDEQILEQIFSSWTKQKPILVHAEGETLEKAINLAKKFGNKLHVCHVSLKEEVEMIATAKAGGLNISCEVTCHHLFLTEEDGKRLGPFGRMKPPLRGREDQAALWQGISDGTIDMIASDHAPHTKEEKLGEKPPNGVPGLETSLSLLLTAVNEGRLSLDKLIELTSKNPRKVFGIPEQEDTYVEVDLGESYVLENGNLQTKCGWTPFAGMKVMGKVKKVVLRGQLVYDGQNILGPYGQILETK